MNRIGHDPKARAKALREVRHALGVSIIGAIKNAGNLDERNETELQVVASEVEKILGFIKEQLGQTDSSVDAETEVLNDALELLRGIFNAPRENVGSIECYRPRLSVKRINGLAWRIEKQLKGYADGDKNAD